MSTAYPVHTPNFKQFKHVILSPLMKEAVHLLTVTNLAGSLKHAAVLAFQKEYHFILSVSWYFQQCPVLCLFCCL